MHLFGRTSSEALAHLTTLNQVARVDSFVDADGPSRGSRRLRIISGGGLEVEVHPDRCLDLGQVTVDGVPIAWTEPGGVRGPASLGSDSNSWLRAWGGGLLTTCGLDSYGAPSRDQGQDFGLHGRVSGIAASSVSVDASGENLVVQGTVRQSTIGAESLTLQRRIEVPVGGTELVISDVVMNEGAREAVHMILYHCNLGWPFIEDGVVLHLPSVSVEPRDDVSALGLDSWHQIKPPVAENAPEVFLHDLRDLDPVAVRVENRRLGLALDLEFDREQLPWLCQWNLFAHKTYVLGLEPMNTRTVVSRAHAREHGALVTLPPGGSVEYRLRFAWQRVGVQSDS